MPLVLPMQNPNSDEIYQTSYHLITRVNTDGLAGTCQLIISVWASAAAFLAKRAPIYLKEIGQDFFVINCSNEEYNAITGYQIQNTDVGVNVKTVLRKSAEAWLATIDEKRTGLFDYTSATKI